MDAWIFDVDGTITDPEKKIPQPKILKLILKRLEKNWPVSSLIQNMIEAF